LNITEVSSCLELSSGLESIALLCRANIAPAMGVQRAVKRLGLTPAGGTFMCLCLSIMWGSNKAFHKLSYETEQVYNFSSVTAALHELIGDLLFI
jgi:hypothetical protein